MRKPLPNSLTYTKVFDSESQAMRGLEGWIRDLFCTLVRLSDYQTGRGRTSYLQLQKLITPDAVQGRKVFAPSIDQMRRAVNKLEEKGLLLRDVAFNIDTKVLIFLIVPRTVGKSVLDKNSPANSRGSFHWENEQNSPANSPASSLGISLLNSHSSVDKSSASVDKSTPMPQEVRDLLARLKGGGNGTGKATDTAGAAGTGGAEGSHPAGQGQAGAAGAEGRPLPAATTAQAAPASAAGARSTGRAVESRRQAVSRKGGAA